MIDKCLVCGRQHEVAIVCPDEGVSLEQHVSALATDELTPCPRCAELEAENARLETELSNSIHEHGQSSGFWGRAAAREVDMRRKAEQRLVARIAERDA